MDEKLAVTDREHIWSMLKTGVPTEKNILAFRGDPQKLEEIRKLLEGQQKLHGVEVAKW